MISTDEERKMFEKYDSFGIMIRFKSGCSLSAQQSSEYAYTFQPFLRFLLPFVMSVKCAQFSYLGTTHPFRDHFICGLFLSIRTKLYHKLLLVSLIVINLEFM